MPPVEWWGTEARRVSGNCKVEAKNADRSLRGEGKDGCWPVGDMGGRGFGWKRGPGDRATEGSEDSKRRDDF